MRHVKFRGLGALSVFLLSIALLAFPLIRSGLPAEKADFQFRKQLEIQQVRPKKPVKIKLHRNAKGEYSWDLTGDDADEIAQIDRKLRRLLKIQ